MRSRRPQPMGAVHRAVAVLAVVAATTGAAFLMPGESRAVDPATAEAQRLEAYWTGDRIRGATPRDLVLDAPPGEGPATTPGESGGPAFAATAVDGAPWTAGGAILQRSGLIVFTMGGNDYSCTGSVITDGNDPAYSLVLTAAHCAYDESTDEFASDWLYIPAWDSVGTPPPADPICGETLFGCWYARALVVHGGWADEEDLTVQAVRHDYAIAVVGPGGAGDTQLDALGAYPLRTSGVQAGDAFDVFGYPANSPYDGSELIYCDGSIGIDAVVLTWRLLCDMTGGASGGPWIRGSSDPAGTTGEVASVSSYRITGDPNLYGPRFDAATLKVYQAALATSPDAGGIVGLIVPTPFTDIGGSTFETDIEWLYASGITTGCAPTLFCPKANVTREQMAAFLVRALDLPSTGTDYFTDDEISTFEQDINALRAAGITTGCKPGLYCPKANVTREQMAAFLVRGFELPATTDDYFVDDETSTFEQDINDLRASGVTTGCDATHYCPKANVTREQMAGFLHRAID